MIWDEDAEVYANLGWVDTGEGGRIGLPKLPELPKLKAVHWRSGKPTPGLNRVNPFGMLVKGIGGGEGFAVLGSFIRGKNGRSFQDDRLRRGDFAPRGFTLDKVAFLHL